MDYYKIEKKEVEEKGSKIMEENQLPDNPTEHPIGADVKSVPPSFTIWRIWKNLLVTSSAFLCLFTAFKSMQNLQSSLNKEEGIGTISLSILYVCGMISGLLLPPFIISRLGCKWTMVVSMSGYLLFMAANLYPIWGTMVPTSVLIGLGYPPLWSAKCTYLTQIGNWYAKNKQTNRDGVISSFFGVFFMAFQSSQIWGNLISSTVFSQNIDNVSLGTFSSCGANYCPGSYRNNTNLDRPNMSKIYTLCGIYLACAALAMVIVAVFLDNLPNGHQETKTETKSLVLAIVKHFWNSRFQKLLIPLTIYCGIEQAFVAGEFTRSFISCSTGVWNVGYIMIVYGVVDAMSSLVVGRLVSKTGFLPLFVAAFFLHGGSLVALSIWNPQGQGMHVFYVFACLLGIGDAIIQTLINALYGFLFTTNPEAGFSSYRLYESTGFTIAFGYSSFLCTDLKIYIALALLLIGTIMYLLVEIQQRRQTQNGT